MQTKKFFHCERINDECIIVWNNYKHSFILCNPYYNTTLQSDIKDFSIINIEEHQYLLTLTDYSITLYKNTKNAPLNIVFKITLNTDEIKIHDCFIFVKLGNSIYKINDLDILKIEIKQCLDELKKFEKDSGITIDGQRTFNFPLYNVTLPQSRFTENFAGIKLLNDKSGFFNSNFKNYI